MVSTPQNGLNTPLQAAFARQVPVWPHFGGFWPVPVHRKGVRNGQQGLIMTFSENDTGPFGVSLEVFSAPSEALLSRFDLRRVVRFTYPQYAFQTMHALQKEVNAVKWGFTKKRETHPLQLGPSTQS